MHNIQISYPQNIIFGENSIEQIGESIPENLQNNVLIVSGKHSIQSGLVAQIAKKFKNTQIYSDIPPEAPLEGVQKLVNFAKTKKITAICAIGGGSVIDSAKCAAAIIPLEGSVKDYFYAKKTISKKGLFFVAVPTTAGSGAEITKNSVLKDTETEIKQSIRHITMIPDIAIIDPILTLSCPKKLTAACGMDALTQAIESYTTVKANSITKSLASCAVKKIYNNLNECCNTPSAICARTEVAEGSLLSAMAFSQSGLGAVHGLAHPIGSKWNIPHGEICSILLPHILELNSTVSDTEYSELGIQCNATSTKGFIDNIKKLSKEIGISNNLKCYSTDKNDIDFIIKNSRSNSMSGNPRFISDNEIVTLLEKL